jgi:hypothetical protein
MPRARSILGLVSSATLVLYTSGCVDTRPSAGRCTGTLSGVVTPLAIDASASQFHRDDDILLDDDAPFVVSYGGGAVVFDGELADLPDDRLLGTHDTSSTLFHAFASRQPLTPTLASATMTTTTARADRLVATIDATYDDGSTLRCELDLRRAYELDTDD